MRWQPSRKAGETGCRRVLPAASSLLTQMPSHTGLAKAEKTVRLQLQGPSRRRHQGRSFQPDIGSLLPQRCTGALHAALPNATRNSFTAAAGEGRGTLLCVSKVQTLELCPGEPTFYWPFQDLLCSMWHTVGRLTWAEIGEILSQL